MYPSTSNTTMVVKLLQKPNHRHVHNMVADRSSRKNINWLSPPCVFLWGSGQEWTMKLRAELFLICPFIFLSLQQLGQDFLLSPTPTHLAPLSLCWTLSLSCHGIINKRERPCVCVVFVPHNNVILCCVVWFFYQIQILVSFQMLHVQTFTCL